MPTNSARSPSVVIGWSPRRRSREPWTPSGASARRAAALADVTTGNTWWLLPPTLGEELDDVRTITVHPRGWVLRCPPVLYPVRGRVWLERPDGSGRLTDPVLLGAALSPGGGPRLPEEAFA
jgi:hypothetical protein